MRDIKTHIDSGEIVAMQWPAAGPWFPVTLRRIGATYELRGPTGIHRLDALTTDAERLAAHWIGFQANARTFWR